MTQKISHIPEGYHSMTPYLIVNQAAQAIDFYKQALGAIELMRMTHPGGKIGHAELQIGNSKFMLADEHPQLGALAPAAFGGSPVSLHLYVEDVDQIVANALAAGATLLRPVEDMFYGDRSGAITDPFGHKWYIATHVEDVSPDELKKRAEAFYSQKKK